MSANTNGILMEHIIHCDCEPQKVRLGKDSIKYRLAVASRSQLLAASCCYIRAAAAAATAAGDMYPADKTAKS